MWFAANSRIMHELLRTGKLSASTSDIADYLAYTVKFAELLESHTLASAVAHNNECRKLQCEYGFGGGATGSTFTPSFSLSVVLRRSQPQTHPTHKNFPHALTANRRHLTQLQFAASLIP